MKPYARADRVGVRIQAVLSELLKKKIRDPRVEMVTITSVKLTSDLRVAYVYFTVFGEDHKIEDVHQGFESSRGFIKKSLAAKLGLRYMPDLKFVHDTSFDRGARIDALLQSVSKDDESEDDEL